MEANNIIVGDLKELSTFLTRSACDGCYPEGDTGEADCICEDECTCEDS